MPVQKSEKNSTSTHYLHQEKSQKKRFLPQSLPIIYRSGYAVDYDLKRRNPSWVYEDLTATSINGKTDRSKIKFKEDPSIPPIFRSTTNDYKGSGFDRGHLAPAANHKATVDEMTDTFYLSNISPQCPELNRGSWNRLEQHIRDLTKEYAHVYVISGPLYLPSTDKQGNRYVTYRLIGKDIAVPTHFFKVINMESASGEIKTKAYILPNDKIDKNVSLDHFRTSLSVVESVSGIIFSLD